MKQVFYVPDRGDVIWITLPSKGGRARTPERRTVVVLSRQSYNSRVGLAVVCPVSANVKGYPFEVLVPPGLSVRGAILPDQVESLDWRTRRAELICSLSATAIGEALGKLHALLA